MPASQQFITDSTPMGSALAGNGVTFRVWAPNAEHVHVVLNAGATYQPKPADELVENSSTGHWTGFFPGVVDGTQYRYFITGKQAWGFQTRSLGARTGNLRLSKLQLHRTRPKYLSMHDQGFRTPPF